MTKLFFKYCGRTERGGMVWLSLLLGLATARNASAVILQGGVDPAHLGKGDWIYIMAEATAHLGGNVSSVHDLASLMAYEKSQGMNFLVVKAGDGATAFPSTGPQFTAGVVNAAHAAGLFIFGYTRSYGTNIPGELNVITNALNLGADGYVIDAESEWESQNLPGNVAAAVKLLAPIKQLYPQRFLAHSPFMYIHYHSTFPYIQFGIYCDAVMPQDYWTSFGITPAQCVTDMDTDWRNWQTALTGTNRNAIKPIIPIGQGWSPSASSITTGAQITQFSAAMSNDVSPAVMGGYQGVLYFRAELHSADMWTGIGGVTFPPSFTTQPTNLTIVAGQSANFGVLVAGTPSPTFQWRLNSTNLSGATNHTYTILNAQGAQAGNYSVVISNRVKSMTSSVASLTVIVPASVTRQPLAQSVKLGGEATFDVGVTGTEPVSYQWQFNGANIPGAMTNRYTVTNAQATNAGLYAVKTSNIGGTNSSDSARLEVIIPQRPHIDAFNFETGGAWQINLTGDMNSAYIIQESTDLIHWLNLVTNLNTNGTLRFANPGTNANTRYYRLELAP